MTDKPNPDKHSAVTTVGTFPSIDSINCFVAAAQQLNFRAASRIVGLTPAALGKRIQHLEDQLQTRLFDRTTRRVELTDAGLALLPHAQRLLLVAADCVRAAQGDNGPTPIELLLGVPHALGTSWLVPALARLRQELPHITIHLEFAPSALLEDRVEDFAINGAVVEHKLGHATLEAFFLHPREHVFVASSSLLADKPLATIENAAAHTLIDLDSSLPLFHFWRAANPEGDTIRFARTLSMGTEAAIKALALADEGVAVLPRYLVADELASGALTPIMPEITPLSEPIQLAFRRDDPRKKVFRKIARVLSKQALPPGKGEEG